MAGFRRELELVTMAGLRRELPVEGNPLVDPKPVSEGLTETPAEAMVTLMVGAGLEERSSSPETGDEAFVDIAFNVMVVVVLFLPW